MASEPTDRDKLIEAIARAICEARGHDPDYLEPGDALGVDGYNRKGEPGHFLWREFVDEATAALAVLERTHVVVPLEPTEAMIRAWTDEWHEGVGTIYLDDLMRRGYRAMLAASTENSHD